MYLQDLPSTLLLEMLENNRGNTLIIFLAKLLLLTVLTFGLTYFIYTTQGIAIEHTLYGIFIYLFTLTLGVHILLNNANKKSGTQFITAFMGITGGKIFISLGLLTAYFMVFKSKMIVHALTFSILYIIFSFFEVLNFLKLLKK